MSWISSSLWLSVFCLSVCLAVHINPVEKASIVLKCPPPNNQTQWQARLNRDSDLIVPDPPVVTSNAGIPETRGRCKQGWALSKTSSQCSRAGASWNWGETEEVLCQDYDTGYQGNSSEEEERQCGEIRGGWGGGGGVCTALASRPRPVKTGLRLCFDSAGWY